MNMDIVNELAPKHGRTSCSDEAWITNAYYNREYEFGSPRCTRCAMIYRVKMGSWPYDAKVMSCDLVLGDDR